MIEIYLIVRLLHVIALAWGLGGSTVSAMLMKKSENDSSMIGPVAKMHQVLSKITWGGIGLLIISGVLLAALPQSSYDTTVLTVKHLLVIIIVLDGLYFTYKGMPKMRALAPKGGKKPSSAYVKAYGEMKKVGMLSMFSWYAIVILSVLF